MSRWFLSYIVFVVAVPFLLFLFKTILACIKAGGRNKPSIGIKALPFSRSSGQTQWKQRQKLSISPKQIYHCHVILRCFRVVSNSPKRDANWFFKLLLGPVYMEWGTPVWWGWFLLFSRSGGHKTKETYPTRPGSPTPCKQGLTLHTSFDFGTSCPKIKVWCMRSNGILFL